VLALTRTTDVLATVAAGSPRPFVVGFAAETQNVERNALAKLEGKRLDMIAANEVGDRLAFDCDDNALTVYWPGGRRELGRAPKRELADALVALIAERYGAGRASGAEPGASRGAGSIAAR
jgi:phosphopantothenoylcysteine decarboxylase/phosphopantothenate--cysteine ligase